MRPCIQAGLWSSVAVTNTREKKTLRAERSALAGSVRGWLLIMVEKAWSSSLCCVDQEAEKRDGAITHIPACLLLFHPGHQPIGGSHLH